MMERLREGANSFVVKIILGLIILSFVFAGVGGYIAGGNVVPAAEVGGVEITQNQFEQAYQNERQQMLSQAGDFFASLLSDPNYQAQFRQNVLDKMVNQALLEQYVEMLGIRVSNEQIKNDIRGMAAFSSNGIFNNEQYLAALRRAGLSPEQFAEYVRQDIEREYLLTALQSSEFVLKTELENLHKLEAQERVIRTLTLPVDDFAKNVDVTDEQLKAYYDSNASKFMRPEQYKIAYIELSGEGIAGNADITDAAARAYYDSNQANYGTAEKRKVRHIMIQIETDDAEGKAKALLAELNQGADFAEIAEKHSQDEYSAQQGGQLDAFEKGVMDPAFEAASFALEKTGDRSDVVESEFGFHIIQLDEIEKSNVTPFESVKNEIIAQLKNQNAAEKFYELSNKMAEKAFEMPDNLDEAAQAVNVQVKTTDFVAMNSLPGVLNNQKVIQALQQPEVMDDSLNSELIEIAPEQVVIARIEDIRPETILPFEDVKSDISILIKREEGENQANALAKKLTADLSANNQESLTDSGYSFSEAKTVLRTDPEKEVVKKAFTMSAISDGDASFSHTRLLNGDYVVVALDKVNVPNVKEVALDALNERVTTTLANTDVASVINQLKEMIDVKYLLDTKASINQ